MKLVLPIRCVYLFVFLIFSKPLWWISVNSGGPIQPNPFSLPPSWCPWDLFRPFKICSDSKDRFGCGKQREATAPIQSLIKLQPWFLSLWWKTCLRQKCNLGSCACSEVPALGQNTLMRMMMMMMIFRKLGVSKKKTPVKFNPYKLYHDNLE